MSSDLGDIDRVGERFEAAWLSGARPRIEDFLPGPAPQNPGLFEHLLGVEVERRRERGEQPMPAEYRDRFPDCERLIKNCFSPQPPTVIQAPAGLAGAEPFAPDFRLSDFDLEEELGSGGMGRVWRARQRSVDRRVALKMLRDVGAGHPDAERRFLREAKLVAQMKHPHIVTVYGVGHDPDQGYFMAMELMEGGTLEDLVGGKALPPQRAAEVVAAAAAAVEHAHQRKVIHRDLNPKNILLDHEGRVKVADFGLAKPLEAGSSSLTEAGLIVGTLYYMAPEQASPSRGEVGPHTDIYALGGVLYRLLTGQPPFRGPEREVLARLLSPEPVRLPEPLRSDLPAGLVAVTEKCLSKDTADRYETAAEVARILRSGGDREPAAAVGFKVVTVVGARGGVGKSTLVCRIAEMIAERGRSVLIVDLDTGAAGTTSLQNDRGQLGLRCSSTYDLLRVRRTAGPATPRADPVR
jgi:serine/threonine-protein kinase